MSLPPPPWPALSSRGLSALCVRLPALCMLQSWTVLWQVSTCVSFPFFACELSNRSLYWRMLIFFPPFGCYHIHEDIFKWKVYLLLLSVYRESGLLSQWILCLTFWRTPGLVLRVAESVFHSYHSEWRIMFPTFLSTLIIVLWFLWSIFDHSHSFGCGIVLPGFEFHFPNNQRCLASS